MNAAYGLACWTFGALVAWLLAAYPTYLQEADVKALEGPISSRLRKLFGSGDRGWNPGRPADVAPPKSGTPLPPGVTGKPLGGRRNRKDT